MKDLFVFGLAHLGAFVLIRDILETSGVNVIADGNGKMEYEAEMEDGSVVDLPDPTTYIIPEQAVTQSEVWNYMLLGDAMAKYAFQIEHMAELYNKGVVYVTKLLGFAAVLKELPFRIFFGEVEETEVEVEVSEPLPEIANDPLAETFIGFNRPVSDDVELEPFDEV